MWDICFGYLFWDTFSNHILIIKRYPTISYHILSYPFISFHILQYPRGRTPRCTLRPGLTPTSPAPGRGLRLPSLRLPHATRSTRPASYLSTRWGLMVTGAPAAGDIGGPCAEECFDHVCSCGAASSIGPFTPHIGIV
jgi:hypothetical protein